MDVGISHVMNAIHCKWIDRKAKE